MGEKQHKDMNKQLQVILLQICMTNYKEQQS